jgi:hypothetical protein
MTNFLEKAEQEVEKIFHPVEQEAETAWDNFRAALEKDWGAFATIASTDLSAIFNTVVGILTSMGPTELAALIALAKEALTDVANGDFADIETSVLLKAEQQGLAFVKALGSSVLQTVIGIVKVSL